VLDGSQLSKWHLVMWQCCLLPLAECPSWSALRPGANTRFLSAEWLDQDSRTANWPQSQLVVLVGMWTSSQFIGSSNSTEPITSLKPTTSLSKGDQVLRSPTTMILISSHVYMCCGFCGRCRPTRQWISLGTTKDQETCRTASVTPSHKVQTNKQKYQRWLAMRVSHGWLTALY